MKRFHTVLFDLDGTLLYTLEDLAASLNYSLRKNGLAPRSTEEIRGFIGWGVRHLVEAALPGGEADPLYSKIMEDYRAHYALHSADSTRPYEGILPLLDALRERGVPYATVTNKPHDDAVPLMERLLGERMPLTVGKKPGVAPKPAPDSLLAAMRELGAEAGSTVYVGDTEVDFQTAQNAGIPCLLAGWGYRSRDTLEALGALAVLDSPAELLRYF